MKVHFIGTGTGIPGKRASPALLIELEGESFLFDIGPGTTRQLFLKGFGVNNVDSIFITHFHVDHCGDLPAFLFASNYEENPRNRELLIYGPTGMKRHMEKLIDLYGEQVVGKKYVLTVVELKPGECVGSRVKVRAFKTLHREESVGYVVESEGLKVVYTGDTDYDGRILEVIDSADLLITECSLPFKVKGHLTPGEAGRIAQEAGVKRLALIHLYPIMDEAKALVEVRDFYSGEILIPRDLETLEL